MPKEITSYFSKPSSYADKRKAALEKRRQLLEELHIDAVTSDIVKSMKQKKKEREKKIMEENIPAMPARKSRRLMGEKPEFVPDDVFTGEARPYIPPKSDKEKLLEIEGAISYDGDFDASELSKEGDMSSFFETIKMSGGNDGGEVGNLPFEQWTAQPKFSGAKKVVPGRIYSMAVHPKTDNLLIAAGDKGGYMGFWSLPNSITQDNLEKLENGMLDISDVGKTWQFKLSHEPITRLFYNSDQTSLYSCSYDKTVKRLDMDSMKFETIFKADSARFDSEVFLHHCTPDPNQEHLFYISLGNGEVILLDSRSKEIQASFQSHDKKVNTIDIHPNTYWMLTASLGRSVRLFDIRKLPTSYTPHYHERIKEAPCETCLHDYIHPLSVNSAFFNQSGDMIVTTCQDNFLRVYPTLTTVDAKEQSVKIQHRNNTGKWLTKLMAEWYKPSNPPSYQPQKECMSGIQYFVVPWMNLVR